MKIFLRILALFLGIVIGGAIFYAGSYYYWRVLHRSEEAGFLRDADLEFEPGVIYEDEYIKMSYTGGDVDSIAYINFELSVENKTDYPVNVSALECSVNGMAATGSLFCDLEPYQTVSTKLSISNDFQYKLKLEKVVGLEFRPYIKISDSEYTEAVAETPVKMETADAASYSQYETNEKNMKLTEVYNDKGIKVSVINEGLKETSEEIFREYLYIENNNESAVYIRSNVSRFNDIIYPNADFYTSIPAGKKGILSLFLFDLAMIHDFEQIESFDIDMTIKAYEGSINNILWTDTTGPIDIFTNKQSAKALDKSAITALSFK